MNSISSLKSSSLQNDIQIENDGPTDSNIDDEAGYALECGCIVTVRLQLHRVLWFGVRSNQDILRSSTLLFNFGHFHHKTIISSMTIKI